MSDLPLRQLLDTASFLNSKLEIQNQEDLKNKTLLKKESLEGQKVILEDLKDGIETYNREYLEREADLNNTTTPVFNNVQDYSLFIFFAGFALFNLAVLVYIFRFSHYPFMLGISFMFLITIIYVFLVFIIQRLG
jgi:hypothetical protein